MKATINGVQFEGTPAEFNEFLAGGEKKVVTPEMPEKHTVHTWKEQTGIYVKKTGKRKIHYGLTCDCCGKTGLSSVGMGVHKLRSKTCRKLAGLPKFVRAKVSRRGFKTRYRIGKRKSVVGGNAHHEWTKQEEDYLRVLFGRGLRRKELVKQAKMNLNRTKRAIMVHVRLLGMRWNVTRRRRRPGEIGHAVPSQPMPSQPSVQIPFLPHKDALAEAIVVERFPELAHVPEKLLAVQMFKHAAVMSNTMNFAQDGYTLGIDGGNEWREFCEDILLKTDAIAGAIGFRPKLTRIGRGITISFAKA